MELWVNDKSNEVHFGLSGVNDIAQCVRTLLKTIKGTVYMDRKLGIDSSLVDTPLTQLSLKNKEIFETLERFEPRIEVLQIKHEADNQTGAAITSVRIGIKEKYIRM